MPGRLRLDILEKRKNGFLKFLFLFRWATMLQIQRYGQVVLGLKDARQLVWQCEKKKYIARVVAPVYAYRFSLSFFVLTANGKKEVLTDSSFAGYDYTVNRLNSTWMIARDMAHDSAVLETYLYLTKSFNITFWKSDWMMRKEVMRNKRLSYGVAKVADAVIILGNGLKIALEVETRRKNSAQWKKVFQRYSVDLFMRANKETRPAVDGVLVVALDDMLMENIARKVFNKSRYNTFPETFFLVSLPRLANGRGRTYKGILELKSLPDYFRGLKNG